MKKRKRLALLLLTVCTVMLVWSVTQIRAIGNNLQYLVPAPEMETGAEYQDAPQTDQQTETKTAQTAPNAKIQELLESLQMIAENWDGIIEAYTLSGIVEDTAFAGDTDETIQTRLNALGPNAFLLAPEYLLAGRLFHPEELQYGSHGILLDEQLALALFRITEPIGRTVMIDDVEYTVIGVLRHTKRIGDRDNYAAYVPLAALWNQAVQLDALQVTAKPIPGAGARAAFKEDLESWYAGGTLIDLSKEGMGSLLALRVLLFFIGSTAFFYLLGIWKKRLRYFIGDYKERLEVEYARKLMPRLLFGTLLTMLTGLVLLFAASMLITYIIAPVYTFPEWVPAVLVEWEDIQSAFWQVWQGAAGLRELRSPELIRVRYFGMVTNWCSAITACLLLWLWGLQHGKCAKERLKQSLD